MSSVLRVLAAGLALVATLSAAAAQGNADADAASYPNHTVRVVVPFPPGGPADLIARFVAQKLAEDWGQPVVIENRPGGNTAPAAQTVARATPELRAKVEAKFSEILKKV